tara:strand:- start:3495 stop:3830 length:336 start_codon:yes stop_codon:yes gene_type:complete
MKNLICEDWELYDKTYKGVASRCSATGQQFADIEEVNILMRVFGTEEQVMAKRKEYNIDEIYSYKIEKEGSFFYRMADDIDAYNKRVVIQLAKYEKLYKLNNNELIILSNG